MASPTKMFLRRSKNANALFKKRKMMNVGGFSYFSGHYPTVNICLLNKGFEQVSGGGAVTQNGWVTALAPGASCKLFMVLALDAVQGSFPTGDYKLVTTSPATISMNGSSGLTNVAQGVGTCTFTVPNPGPGNWDQIYLVGTFTNNTGAAFDITDVACYLASEEASYQADHWAFKRSFLEDFVGVEAIRFMDWNGANGATAASLAEYGPQNVDGVPGFAIYGVPWTLCAKLAKELGVIAWICTPQANKARPFTYTAATSTFTAQYANTSSGGTPHYLQNGERVIAYTYDGSNTAMAPLGYRTILYVVNRTDTTYQLATTPGGAPVSLTAGVDLAQEQFSYAAMGSLDGNIEQMVGQIAAAMHAVAPGIRIIAEHSNEVWNFGFNQFRFAEFAGAYLATGVLQNNLPAGYAYGMLRTWKGWESVYPPEQVIRCFAGQAANFDNISALGMEYVDPGILDAGKPVKQIMLDHIDRTFYAVAPYITGTNPTGIERPSIEQIYADNGNSTSIPDSYWDACWRRGIGPCKNQMTDSITRARQKVPGIVVSTYEYGTDWALFGSQSPYLGAIGNSCFAWLDSQAGKAFYADAFATLVARTGIQHINHYYSIGGYGARNGLFLQWSLKARQGDSHDTPRSTWFKSL